MNRRRMIISYIKDKENWDLQWDYTMGLPENNGFDKVTSGNITTEIDASGLNINVPTQNDYVRYTPTNFKTCNEGICEIVVNYLTSNDANGNRLILSNPIKGCQIYVKNGYIQYNEGTMLKIIFNSVSFNVDHTIRIEMINGLNKIYFDGTMIYQSTEASLSYMGENRIFFQSTINAILKSIKFKKIS